MGCEGCDEKYGWKVIVLVTTICMITLGEPDIIDGMIHFLLSF